MARQVADSIISMRSADSKDMAQRFVQEFDMEPFRGYGASVGEVFQKLKRSKCQDPYKPASEQFNGSGSYGTMSTNLHTHTYPGPLLATDLRVLGTRNFA